MSDRSALMDRRQPEPSQHPRQRACPPALKLGVALSSGGARGLAHVGVLQVLEENGIEVRAVAGSSMGAYVGALWATGHSGRELEELAAEMHNSRQLWRLADPILPPMAGLFRGAKAREHLRRSIGDRRMEELGRRLLVIAVDIDSKERVVLRSGDVCEAVHASCAMPGIIAPVWVNGRRCIDGGVVDPLPVGALRKFSDVERVLAVSVIPTFEELDRQEAVDVRRRPWHRAILSKVNRGFNLLAPGNMIDTFRQSIRAAQIRMAHDSCKRADICLRPEHYPAPWHDYHGFRRHIEAGRQVAEEHLDEIRELLRAPGTETITINEPEAYKSVVGPCLPG